MDSISVIIPCYNQMNYLFDAVTSILEQQISDLEIIIVDDGSTDISHAVLNDLKQDSRIKIFMQDNQGAASARNLGIKNATKPYLAFLDADDVWLSGKISHQLKEMQDAHVQMVFTYIEQFISPELMTEALKNKPIKNQIMPGKCLSTMLTSRDVFKVVGLFDESLKVGEFIAWNLKTKAHAISEKTIDKVYARRRIHKNNSSYRNKAHRQDYLRILKARQQQVEEG